MKEAIQENNKKIFKNVGLYTLFILYTYSKLLLDQIYLSNINFNQ